MAIKKTPTLDGSGKIFDKHIPSRLQDAALNATYGPTATAMTEAFGPTSAPMKAAYDRGVIARSAFLDATGASDATPILAAFRDQAVADGSVVSVPPGVYRINSLVMGPMSGFVSLGGNTTRVGANGITKPLVIFKHQTSSTQPMIIIDGGGVVLEGIEMQGNYSTAPLLHVADGFESKLDNIRLIGVDGTALSIRHANNTKWGDVFIDNCGSMTAAAMTIKSPTSAEGGETNTLTIDKLVIERQKNVALDIAYGGTRANGFYAEFVEINELHVEAPNDLGGTYNVDPLIRVGNVRSCHLDIQLVYGGPGYLIEYNSTDPTPLALKDGLFVSGGSLLGQEDGSSNHLIHLVSGDDFSLIGVRAGKFNTAAIKVESTFGQRVKIDPSSSLDGSTNVWLSDSRTGAGPTWDWPGGITAKAVTVGSNSAATPISKINGAAGTARRQSFQSGGVDRWFIQASTAAEPGNNSGSDLEIVARTDGGGSLGNVLTMNRRNRTVEANIGFVNGRKAGIPSDADFAVAPSDGTTIVDTANSKLYIRIGGTWKSVTLA